MAARQTTDRAWVLVIEDDTELRELLTRVLHAGGFEPVVATDGHSGIEQVRTGQFDVVIVDLRLPDMSGVTVARAVRAEGHTMPLVILTAHHTQADRAAAFAAGADDYMTKPFEIDALLHRIAAWSAHHRNQSTHRSDQ